MENNNAMSVLTEESLALFREHIAAAMLCSEFFLSHYSSKERTLKTRVANEQKTLLIERETIIDMGQSDISFSLFQGKLISKALDSLFSSSGEKDFKIEFVKDEQKNDHIVISSQDTRFEILTGDIAMIKEPPDIEEKIQENNIRVRFSLNKQDCKKISDSIELFQQFTSCGLFVNDKNVQFRIGAKAESKLGNLITINKKIASIEASNESIDNFLSLGVVYYVSSMLLKTMLESAKNELQAELVINDLGLPKCVLKTVENTQKTRQRFYTAVLLNKESK